MITDGTLSSANSGQLYTNQTRSSKFSTSEATLCEAKCICLDNRFITDLQSICRNSRYTNAGRDDSIKTLDHFFCSHPAVSHFVCTTGLRRKNSNLSSEQRRKSALFLFWKLFPSSPPPSIYLTGRNIKQARGHEVLSGAKLNRLSRRSLPCWHHQRNVELLRVLRVLRLLPSD